MKKFIFILLGIALCFSPCYGQKFIIKKGAHYPSPNPYSWHSGITSIDRSITFDSSCVYNLGTYDDSDINKGFGWGVGLFKSIHSLRIGWNCKSGHAIDLYAYIHYNGKRWTIPKDSIIHGSGQLIGKGFLTNVAISCTIHQARDSISFIAIQGTRIAKYVIRFSNFPKGMGRYEYPYFGGQSVAPHQMKITVE